MMIRILGSLLFLSAFALSAQEKQSYILKSIFFRGGSYQVGELQLESLTLAIDSIPNIQEYTISVHSHTDNIGGARYNKWLAGKRSEAVIEELLKMRLSKNQIELKDFGQFNPVYDNSTWEGRRRNRRVDIIFWPMSM